MTNPSLVQEFTNILQKNADPKVKKWFDNYLRGAIEYRGIKSPKVAKLFESWYQNHKLHLLSFEKQLALAALFLKKNKAEDKFAGIFFVQKKLARFKKDSEVLNFVSQILDKGHFYDWSTTDWLTVRVVGPMIQKNPSLAKEVTSWRKSKNLWKRRVSVVALRDLVKEPQHHPLILKTLQSLVKEQERFIQTGIGWTLADFSRFYPRPIENFLDKNWQHLSLEVLQRHTKYLKNRKKWFLLKKELLQRLKTD